MVNQSQSGVRATTSPEQRGEDFWTLLSARLIALERAPSDTNAPEQGSRMAASCSILEIAPVQIEIPAQLRKVCFAL